MGIHIINGIKVYTSFDYLPIPYRGADWSAVDCDCDQNGFYSNCPVGRGATEQEAIDDLLEQIEEMA